MCDGVDSSPADAKLDSKSSLHLLNELADLHSCNNTLYFEARRHEDLYLWLSRSPNGPSAKCHVQNVHTMDELKMTGNCLKGSRGIVCFDGGWEKEEWSMLMKEMLTHVSRRRLAALRQCLLPNDLQTFSVPRTSRRLKPFIDHILTFSLLDNKIWFRNYQVRQCSGQCQPAPQLMPLALSQIIEKDPLQPTGPAQTTLVEIGPRFVLTPIRMFEGSFGGPTVFENPGTTSDTLLRYSIKLIVLFDLSEFVSPAATRASIKRAQGGKYRQRKETQADRTDRRTTQRAAVGEDELAVSKVFA